MSARRSQEGMGLAVFFVVAPLLAVVAVFTLTSGILPWAILGYVVAGAVVYLLTRDLGLAAGVGLGVAVAIPIAAFMSVISPGWYKDLLP